MRFHYLSLLSLFFILVGLTACNDTKIQLSESSSTSSVQLSKEKRLDYSETSQMILQKEEEQKSLSFMIDGKEFPIIVDDTPTLDALIDELPEKFIMNDLHENEKYYEFSQPIPTNAKAIQKIEAGDVMLFGQRTLVLFYRAFPTSYQYTRIGSIENTESLSDTLVGRKTVEVQLVKK
ncbi:cyclophilin-like fold protein [Enterococcus sp. LJL99]